MYVGGLKFMRRSCSCFGRIEVDGTVRGSGYASLERWSVRRCGEKINSSAGADEAVELSFGARRL